MKTLIFAFISLIALVVYSEIDKKNEANKLEVVQIETINKLSLKSTPTSRPIRSGYDREPLEYNKVRVVKRKLRPIVNKPLSEKAKKAMSARGLNYEEEAKGERERIRAINKKILANL